jgi:hypothetical protein
VVAITLSFRVAYASDLIAVYALVDKVVVEPNSDNPERVQISGVFAMANPNDRNSYQVPQRGYLYFQLPKEHQDISRKEWADLKGIAGTRQVVAFGSRFQMKPRVRKQDEKPEGPDAYVGVGLVKVRSNTDYAPIKSLLEYSGR